MSRRAAIRRARLLSQREVPPIPLGPDGQPLGLTLADIRLAAQAARVLLALTEAIEARQPGLERSESVRRNLIDSDTCLSEAVAHAEAQGVPDTGIMLLPSRLLGLMHGAVFGVQYTHDAQVAAQSLSPAAPTLHEMALALTGQELPSLASLAQVGAQLNRISDALNGKSTGGMQA